MKASYSLSIFKLISFYQITNANDCSTWIDWYHSQKPLTLKIPAVENLKKILAHWPAVESQWEGGEQLPPYRKEIDSISALTAAVVWLLSHVHLFCDPMDCSPPGSSVHGISQARIPEWVAISFSGGFSWPRDGNWVSSWQADSLLLNHLGSPLKGAPGTQMNPVLMGLSVLSLPLLTPSPLKPSISFSLLSLPFPHWPLCSSQFLLFPCLFISSFYYCHDRV